MTQPQSKPKKTVKQLILEDAAYYDAPINELKLNLFAEQLSSATPEKVAAAQRFFRAQPSRRQMPMPADLLDWIAQKEGGHPGVEEAWAMIPKDEASSVVWTEEMQHAFGIASQLLEEDPIAARMAFKEAYGQAVAESRANGKPARWSASLGLDRQGRDAALRDAVQKNRLTLEHAQTINPEFQLEPPSRTAIGFNPTNFLPEFPQ